MSRLPKVAVDVTPESRPFWGGLSRGEIVVTWCEACDDHVWPPRDRCPVCLSDRVGTRVLGGEGTLYSFSIVHRGDPAFQDAGPYVLAYVSLDGGPTIMANVDGVPFDRLEVGMRLRLRAPDGDPNRAADGAEYRAADGAADDDGSSGVGGAVFVPVDVPGEGAGG